MNPQIKKYIDEQRSNGAKDDAIIQALVASGWEQKMAAQTVAASYQDPDYRSRYDTREIYEKKQSNIGQLVIPFIALLYGVFLCGLAVLLLVAESVSPSQTSVFSGQRLSDVLALSALFSFLYGAFIIFLGYKIRKSSMAALGVLTGMILQSNFLGLFTYYNIRNLIEYWGVISSLTKAGYILQAIMLLALLYTWLRERKSYV